MRVRESYSEGLLVATLVVSPAPAPGEFATLAAALAALPPAGGRILVRAGPYPPIAQTLRISTSNVHIQGEGMGITQLAADASMTGNTPVLQAYTPQSAKSRPLTADAVQGQTTLSISQDDAASFNPGDDVLLFSNKSIDSEQPAKHAGEMKRIASVDPASGTLDLEDQIYDTYTLADAARVVRISMLRNITLRDFSISTLAPSSSLSTGFMHFRFVDNLSIRQVEVHDAFYSGIHVQSVLNSSIADCYIHNISDVTPAGNVRYGVLVGDASQNVVVSNCRFAHTRHAVTTGASSGANHNGVQRGVIVSHCTSTASDTAHFDTHEPAENVVFAGCTAVGGRPVDASSSVVGVQVRGRNVSVVGCSVLQAIGKGIMLFGEVSSGAIVSGNMIDHVKSVSGNDGYGVYLSSPRPGMSTATSRHAITGNVIKHCEGSAIDNGAGNDNLVIANNVIDQVNTVGTGAAIQLTNASQLVITGNQIVNSLGAGIVAPADATIVQNTGYNPVGVIARPWPTMGGDLTNAVSAGSPAPRSGQIYTVRQTPKSIVVSGGEVVAIEVNGVDTGLRSGAFKLGIGERIALTFKSAPTTCVYAD